MALEGKTKADGERDGREVGLQTRPLARTDEYASKLKVDGGRGRMRRATFDDLNAIMDINDNIYDGFDYMPTLFYVFMQSKLHIIYVYEEDGKLLSLVNFRLHPDCDDLVSGMSGRVRPSYEGRGLGIAPTSLGHAELFKVRPRITRCVVDNLYTPKLATKMHEVKVNYLWNILVYKLDDRQWMSRIRHNRQMTLPANQPVNLSYACGVEWLERSDQLIRFLSKYVSGLFPCGTNWNPTPVNRSGLRHMLLSNKVYVSMDVSSTINNSNSTGVIQGTGLGTQRSTHKGPESDLVGLSYSTGCPVKYGVRIDIFFYGDDDQVFLSHVYSHLLHYISVISDDLRFGINLNFPQTIDSKNIEELLWEKLGDRYLGIGATQSVQLIVDLPHAKL